MDVYVWVYICMYICMYADLHVYVAEKVVI